MVLKGSKGAITISLEKELIELLRSEADKNKRTVSNQIAFMLEDYLKMKGIQ